jgi:hypothetical protein
MLAQSVAPEGVKEEKQHLFSGELHFSNTAEEVRVSAVSFQASEETF